jgi:hypothetical protein|tara:strand:+ start:901 stop:1524 length:624 start_codon:yes stop_codon:yes gene_type:complete
MFNVKEIALIILMTILLAFVLSFPNPTKILLFLIPIFFVIGVNVLAKKILSFYLDSEIEIKIWDVKRYGFKPKRYFKKPFPAGAFIPIITTVFSFGYFPWLNGLVFDVKAKVYRAARRFGLYTFSEMTEYHVGLIAAVGIFANLFFAIIGYLINLDEFAKLNIYYAFFNLIPLSDLDGNKIFFGSIVLWSFLTTLVLIGLGYVFLVV